MKQLACALVGILSIGLSTQAMAAVCDGPRETATAATERFDEDSMEDLFSAFETAFDAGCYVAERSNADFVRRVEKALVIPPSNASKAQQFLTRSAALNAAIAIVSPAADAVPSANIRQIFDVVLNDYQRALGNAANTGSLPAELGRKDSFTVDGGALDFSYEHNDEESLSLGLQGRVFNTCTTEPFSKSKCVSAVDSIQAPLTVFMALARINDYVVDIQFQELLANVSLLDARWDAYFNRARAQNIVETFVNNTLGAESLDSQTGFVAVPQSQWVALHPSIALEYIDGAASGDQFAQSLVVELVGRDMWRFGDGTAQMKNYWGLSLIGAYSNRGSVDEIGYGLMGHWNRRFSVGATLRDDDVSVFVSIDLQDLLLDWDSKRRRKLLTYETHDNFRNDLKRCLSVDGGDCQLTAED